MKLDILAIELDGGTQPRAQLDFNVIMEYAEAMESGAAFPPVVVFYDGKHYWLADGFHRVKAAQNAGLAGIEAEVRQGTRRDAILYAVGANAGHGLRRTNEDKRRAVLTLLNDPEWRRWNDAEISRRCVVTAMTVGRLRAELISNNVIDNPPRIVQRNGTTYTMDTGNIGRTREPEPTPVAFALPGTTYFCPKCGDVFNAEVWHCPVCDHHWPISRTECWNCHEYDRTPTAEEDLKAQEEPKSRATFNRTSDKSIEWAWWTWNPVTGCEHNCLYCYARDIANRFPEHYPNGFKPTFRPERLSAPLNTQIPELPDKADKADRIGARHVFVCSMADLFGKWVPQEWIDAVLDAVRKSPHWGFIFLTKNPKRLATIDWPANARVGTTVDIQPRVKAAEEAFRDVNASYKFVSCEPLIERLTFSNLAVFDWVIVGGRSRSSQMPEMVPNLEWVNHIREQADAAGCCVYEKPNIRRREYPEGM